MKYTKQHLNNFTAAWLLKAELAATHTSSHSFLLEDRDGSSYLRWGPQGSPKFCGRHSRPSSF
jgi:hypothetical protein